MSLHQQYLGSMRWEVEHHIRFDEGFIWLMAKHQMLIRMTANVFINKLLIKIRIHFHTFLILHRPDMRELCAGYFRILFTFLREASDAEDQ